MQTLKEYRTTKEYKRHCHLILRAIVEVYANKYDKHHIPQNQLIKEVSEKIGIKDRFYKLVVNHGSDRPLMFDVFMYGCAVRLEIDLFDVLRVACSLNEHYKIGSQSDK